MRFKGKHSVVGLLSLGILLARCPQAFSTSFGFNTGDLDLSGVTLQGQIVLNATPLPIQAFFGKSVVIPVDITASGTPGQTVSGTLYLDDNSLWSLYQGLYPNANTVAAIPYSYRVG